MRIGWAILPTLAFAALIATPAGAITPALHFEVFSRTGLRLTDLVWTGRQFLYVDNTTNRVVAAGPAGAPTRPFARMPRQVEETRCVVSPGAYGFGAGDIFCHSPDNKIYRISPDGRTVKVFAVLPHVPRSDGAIAFDDVGSFGHRLVASTGRSGSSNAPGGTVFTISATGRVHRVGSYSTPGGADEIAIAPATFGAAAGQALLTVDAGKGGSLVAMNAHGHAHILARFTDGPNPITVLQPGWVPRGRSVRPGLYVADTGSHRVYHTAVSQLHRFAGGVIVGSERRGLFWVIRPSGRAFRMQTLTTNLGARKYNLEAAIYISP